MNLGAQARRIYVFMVLKDRPIGVRELQRELGFRSPSTVHYHLQKLVRMGLVEQEGEKYIVKRIEPRVLREYVVMGRLLIPRKVFHAVFLTVLLLFHTLLFGNFLQVSIVISWMGLVYASGVLWYEVLELIRKESAKNGGHNDS